MVNFDKVVGTTKKHPWKNTMQYIIVHHTAWWTFISNMDLLSVGKRPASVQYVVWPAGETWKIWNDSDILWHAWKSCWDWKIDKYESFSSYSIWIEVVSDWYNYTDIQRSKTKDLILYLMDKYKIPAANVLRHADITHAKSMQWVLRDWYSKSRKWDIWQNFWNISYKSWQDYQNSLLSKKPFPMQKLLTACIDLNSHLWNMLDSRDSEWTKWVRKMLEDLNTELRKLIDKK